MSQGSIKKQPVALSHTVKDEILGHVEQMGLKPDDLLPTEAELVEKLGVSRHTVREALALLQQDHIIYKRQGKGTFLQRSPMQIGLERLESIRDMTANYGYTPSTVWLDIAKELPDVPMMKELHLSPKEPVVTFKRVKMADDKLIAYCVDSIPQRILRPVLSGPTDLPKREDLESIFDFMESRLGLIVDHAVAEIIPTFAPGDLRDPFGLPPDQLFTLLMQIHYDGEGRPLIYSRDYFSEKYMRFKVNRRK